MGELWRSQEMQLVQLFIQVEAAHDTVDELGKLGLVEFRDLNPYINAFQRNFINEVKRADEMERKLKFFQAQIEEYNRVVGHSGKQIKLSEIKEDIISKSHTDELEARFEDYEKQIIEMNNHQQALHRNNNQLVELHHVLEKDETFFRRVGDSGERDVDETGTGASRGLGFITGVIAREKFSLFERVLFRSTRGNIFIQYAEIAEPIEDTSSFGNMVKKNVFIVFFHGNLLQTKIKKICESFFANLYPCPDSPNERKNLSEQVKLRLEELSVLLSRGEAQRAQLLGIIALSLNSWLQKVKQEKGIYHTMNKFNYDLGRRCLIAEGWIPAGSMDDVHRCLRVGSDRSGAAVPSIMSPVEAKEEPPTFFKINKYTAAAQSMINSYGIARYREINPAVFTMVTFPYEFGIMFGDVGHGILLLLFAIFLIRKEKDWEGTKINEMIEMFYAGRYLIFCMAIFSIFQGFLYNEFFSLPMNFKSVWVPELVRPHNTTVQANWLVTFKVDGYPTNETGTPANMYVFGVDPIWKGSSNELLYYNSVKMKMSVIIGVIQMSLGIFLHFLNAIHFRNTIDIFAEFIPRIIFLWAIFGYLCIMIFLKWCTDYPGQDLANQIWMNTTFNASEADVPFKGTNKAPVILNEMIFMLLPGGTPDNLYHGQQSIQTVLVVIAVLCIPFMACLKPCYLKPPACCWNCFGWCPRCQELGSPVRVHQHEEREEESESERLIQEAAHGGGGSHGHSDDFGEMMVHQLLETIEFVLGSVSHTASYLRLWALSLAHSELATVFWDKVMFMLLEYTVSVHWFVVGLAIFAGFSVWFFITFLVMMFMEGLSAFLHALRLHWVEFQSKFYKGDGHEFQPFSYSTLDQKD